MSKLHGVKRIKKDRSINFESFDFVLASIAFSGGTLVGAIVNNYLVKHEILFPVHTGIVGGFIGLIIGACYLVYRHRSIKKNLIALKKKRKKNRSDFDFGPLR